MNTYPSELLNHHFACMLVAGLVPNNPANASAAASSSSAANHDGNPSSLPSDTNAHPSSAPSSSSSTLAARTEPDAASAGSSSHPAEAFPTLCKDLVDLFSSRGRNAVWDPARGRSAVFHSALVDHSVRLPPHKTRLNPKASSLALPSPLPANGSATSSTNDATSSSGIGTSPSNATRPLPSTSDAGALLAGMPARSPLSPLHPSSPLFPDGLIAPIWTRKHRELIPSVFVAFHCLAERQGGPQAPQTAESGEALRTRDEELIKLIAERKRSLTERGIKMTVVLLTTRAMLEDPQLEARLSYVRRSSGLDSKASLFVLTPVSKQELSEFVGSLHSALLDSALDYYREHARRVKRKRARYPPPPSVVQPILSAAASLQGRPADLAPLSREGWIVRAEYKLATFAELQGDNDEALMRYQEAYSILSGPCLGSTMMLPPRTKRWAEAKVLADTLSIKISKFHLYRDDGVAALRQLRRHLHRFTELSTGWGIGNMTFEYWSWLCKQYRLFADLMDAATRPLGGSSSLTAFALPSHAPPLPARLLHPDILPQLDNLSVGPGMLTPNQAAISAGVSPASMIQGPGTFYYLAALCTIERRDRFHKLVATENLSQDDIANNPSLAHEQKVDYTTQITEQLTRAYDCFKRARQQRLSLLVASKIALTYLEGGQHELALRFLERILRTYQRDGCYAIQSWLVLLAAECALNVEDVESATRILFDLLALRLDVADEQRTKAAGRLASILDGNKQLPEGKERVRIEAGATHGILQVESVFLEESVEAGSAAAFQLRLTAPEGGVIEPLVFDSLAIHVDGLDRPLIVKRGTSTEAGTEMVDVGQLSDPGMVGGTVAKATCGLCWSPGSSKVLQGSIVTDHPGTLKMRSVALFKEGAVPVELCFDLTEASLGPRVGEIHDPRWLIRTQPGKYRWVHVSQRERCNQILVRPRAYRVELSAKHEAFAYLDERFPITLEITNQERQRLDCYADLALQATYEGVDDVLQCGETEPAPQIRHCHFGTLEPGETKTLPFTLRAARRDGPRIVDVVAHVGPVEAEVSSRSRVNTDDSNAEGQPGSTLAAAAAAATATINSSEVKLSVNVPVYPAFGAWFSPVWGKANGTTEGEADGHERDEDDDDDDEDDDDDDDDDAPPSVATSLFKPAFGRQRHRALLETTLELLGPAAVDVHSVEVVLPATAASDAPRLANDFDAATEHEDLIGRWEPRDRYGVSYPLTLRSSAVAPRSPQGHLLLTWTRPSPSHASPNQPATDGTKSETEFNRTTLPLPLLQPPTQPTLQVEPYHPTLARLNVPLPLSLTLTNASSTSHSLLIVLDSSDNFVFAGPRRLSIGHLLAGERRRLDAWTLVPFRTGRVGIPRITVVRKGEEGEEVVWSGEAAERLVDVLPG